MSTTKSPVFVFGTLRSSDTYKAVTGTKPKYTPGTLHNYKKEGLNILESEGDSVEGDIVYASLIELKCLDRYEGIATKLYKHISVNVETNDGDVECLAYQLVNNDTEVYSPYS